MSLTVSWHMREWTDFLKWTFHSLDKSPQYKYLVPHFTLLRPRPCVGVGIIDGCSHSLSCSLLPAPHFLSFKSLSFHECVWERQHPKQPQPVPDLGHVCAWLPQGEPPVWLSCAVSRFIAAPPSGHCRCFYLILSPYPSALNSIPKLCQLASPSKPSPSPVSYLLDLPRFRKFNSSEPIVGSPHDTVHLVLSYDFLL